MQERCNSIANALVFLALTHQYDHIQDFILHFHQGSYISHLSAVISYDVWAVQRCALLVRPIRW